MHSREDTIAAIATSVGESGIGMIRLSGPSSIQILKSIFKPAKSINLETAPSHTCYFGTIASDQAPSLWKREAGRDFAVRQIPPDPPFSKGGNVIDQVVVTLFRTPHSYTGDDVVEISAHGSPFILNQILHACVEKGARLAGPGEFTQRAFLAGKIDLTQAEAVADLIRAKTDQSHAAALSQLEGHLAAKVRALRDQLLPLLAHVEVGLDHSDEDHDFLSRTGLAAQCGQVQLEIEALLSSASVGKILREGLRVALVGRPNAGKSSLLNALLKEDRAIVTPIAGTTRDTLEERVNWEGIPVILTDTAGIRIESHDPVERLGMERTRKALQTADMVLCILDASEPMSEEDQALINECGAKPHLWVMNKADLPVRWNTAPRPHKTISLNPLPSGESGRSRQESGGPSGSLAGPGEAPAVAVLDRTTPLVDESAFVVHVSAKTGEGLPDLVGAVKAFALAGSSRAGEARWMLNVRHQTALVRAREALSLAAEAAHNNAYEECIALELQTALKSLGEVIGETTTEEILGEIFSNFCIGK